MPDAIHKVRVVVPHSVEQVVLTVVEEVFAIPEYVHPFDVFPTLNAILKNGVPVTGNPCGDFTKYTAKRPDVHMLLD